LDGEGNPRISYADSANGDLKYASYVEVPPPVANFTGNPTAGFAPLSVSFTNTSTGYYTSCLWHFGDGQTSTQHHPNHTYAQGGIFSVTLTVSVTGGEDSLTRQDYIEVFEVETVPLYLPMITKN
jgi:PKD repeat protein